MARDWIGKNKDPEPPSNGDETKQCTRCQGTGSIHVVPAKSKEHGGKDPYDEDCSTCSGTGQVPK